MFVGTTNYIFITPLNTEGDTWQKWMVTSLKNSYNKVQYRFCLNIRKRFFVEVLFKNQIKENKVL